MMRLGRKIDHRATPMSMFDSNYNKPMSPKVNKVDSVSDIKGIEIPIDGELYDQIVNGSLEVTK